MYIRVYLRNIASVQAGASQSRQGTRIRALGYYAEKKQVSQPATPVAVDVSVCAVPMS